MTCGGAEAAKARKQAVVAAGGVELEAIDADEFTAFLRACNKGSAECIAALAEAGCDTAARSSEGRTGLMYAADSGLAATVKAVVALGEVELRRRSGMAARPS